MISTGDIKGKNYEIIGIIGATVNNQSVEEKKGMFGIKYDTVVDIDTNSMYEEGAAKLLKLATEKGGDAVIYANFEYRIAITGSGNTAKQVKELFCYGTCDKLT
ncbi:MAG: hypothetical protein P8O83_03220 [Flavobacteriaceae bacterium]|nr:hypothetical protein [Flavobacteriaceae bacterium]